LSRAVEKTGDTLYFVLFEHSDAAAANLFNQSTLMGSLTKSSWIKVTPTIRALKVSPSHQKDHQANESSFSPGNY